MQNDLAVMYNILTCPVKKQKRAIDNRTEELVQEE